MDNLGKSGCSTDVCSSFLKIQDGKDAIACTLPSRVKESVGTSGECTSSRSIPPSRTDVPLGDFSTDKLQGFRQSPEMWPLPISKWEKHVSSHAGIAERRRYDIWARGQKCGMKPSAHILPSFPPPYQLLCVRGSMLRFEI